MRGVGPDPYRRSMSASSTSRAPVPSRAAAAAPALVQPSAAAGHAVRATVAVILGSALIGGLTSPAQQYLPAWINSLANSAGGWTAFVFLLVWLARARPILAVVLGVVAFEAMVEAYGLVSGWRGHYYSAPFSSIWSGIGLVVGPIMGVAATAARYGSRGWRLLGVAALSAVLIADGTHGLLVLLTSTSPVFWTLEIVAGASFFALALVRVRR